MSAPADFAFAGYLITRPVARPAGMDSSLIPERILTASSCFACVLPDTWALSWGNVTEEERREALRMFGIAEKRFADLARDVDAIFHRGAIVFPSLIVDEEAARELWTWTKGCEDAIVLGLGLPMQLVPRFLEDQGRFRNPPPDPISVLEQRRPMPSGGELRGFELLASDPPGTFSHTQICNGLEKDLLERHGAHLNAFGLIDDLALAQRWATEITREKLGEPLLWLPWAVFDYSAWFGREPLPSSRP